MVGVMEWYAGQVQQGDKKKNGKKWWKRREDREGLKSDILFNWLRIYLLIDWGKENSKQTNKIHMKSKKDREGLKSDILFN